MNPKRAVVLFASLWLLCFALSIAHPVFIEPTGDGFTRGLNRLTAAFGWQAAASLFALIAFVAGVGKMASDPILKWTSRIPAIIQLLLILSMAGLVVYLRFSKPSPESEPPAMTPTQTAPNAAVVPNEPFSLRYTGIFHSGFEKSHFYSADGRGPWWVEADETVWKTLEPYRIDRTGRGGGIWVGLDVEAASDENTNGLAHLGRFEGRMTLLTVNSVRKLEPEAFEQLRENFSRLEP